MPELVVKDISEIQTCPQVRKEFDQDSLEELAASIREAGLLQPILCRMEHGRLIVVDGERRLRACRLVGLPEIPVLMQDEAGTPAQILQQQLIANIQRKDLGLVEKAEAIQSLMTSSKTTGQQVARLLGMSPASVTRTLAVFSLPAKVREQVASGKLSASAAYELSLVKEDHEREELARQFMDGQLDRAGAVARRRKANQGTERSGTRLQRAAAVLGEGRSVTVTGEELDLDAFISALELLLAKARRSRTQGVSLPTLLKLLKEQAAVAC